MENRFIVGIDLGTTNSSVAYIDLENKNNKTKIHGFKIEQLTEKDEFSPLPVLPSFLYIPSDYDTFVNHIKPPWKIEHRTNEDKNFIGKFARDYGAKRSSRLISSAKSWLCNKAVDKKARILPWGSDAGVLKISPVQASASYLKHIRKAWNSAQGNDDSAYLENQTIIITVPASFDEIARDLTLKSAKIAGFNNVLLLEEPLAAFYNWLSENEKKWSEYVKPNQLILVCDVGGGTTDFTLIYLRKTNDKVRFERLAVGDHLILGGDNIDIEIAKKAFLKLYGNTDVISNNKWNTLCYQCRKIKEKILEGKTTCGRVTITGSGSNLISDTSECIINLEDIQKIIFRQFFPDTIKFNNQSNSLNQLFSIPHQGIPYESNMSITYHLGNFIKQNEPEIERSINEIKSCPDLILFNGGSLKPTAIQNRILSFLTKNFAKIEQNPVVIKNQDMNSAVSFGAAYYGLVKNGHGLQIGSGTSRAYYIGMQTSHTSHKPSLKQAMCLVERGLEEGSSISLSKKQFEVLTNQPINIKIYSSSFRSGDRSGDIINVDETLTTMPPINTVIQFGEKGIDSRIPITIEGRYTEVGTLELWCKSVITPHRWQLKFQLRNTKHQSEIDETEIFDHSKLKLARNIVKNSFLKTNEANKLNFIVKNITEVIKKNKHQWPLAMLRNLVDTALEHMDARKISPAFESRWMNFVGFCLRPGIGEGFDPYRIKKVWKFYKQGPIYYNNAQVRSEWWIMWRRIAAGLNRGQQQQFLQDITPVLLDKKNHKKSKQEKIEIWMAAANMEGIYVKDKIKIGTHLMDEITIKKTKPQLLWALSRLGSRNLLYSSIDRVIGYKEISKWLLQIISTKWHNPKPVIDIVSLMAQKTGDQVRDIRPDLRKKITDWIKLFGIFPNQTKKINQIVKRERLEEKIIFGESIPSGIILKFKD